MKQDEEGFFYPAVDPARCIDCGLCEGVCPILKKQAPQPAQRKAYAARATEDALREKSSSGGLFTLLAVYDGIKILKCNSAIISELENL